MWFTADAAGMEIDAVSKQLDLQVKQCICKTCQSKLHKKVLGSRLSYECAPVDHLRGSRHMQVKFTLPAFSLSLSDISLEVLEHVWGVRRCTHPRAELLHLRLATYPFNMALRSTRESLLADWRHCLLKSSAATLPYSPRFAPAPISYAEPLAVDWGAAAARADLPALCALLASADERRSKRDAARVAYRSIISTATSALAVLDAAAVAEDEATASMRKMAAARMKEAARSSLIKEAAQAQIEAKEAAQLSVIAAQRAAAAAAAVALDMEPDDGEAPTEITVLME